MIVSRGHCVPGVMMSRRRHVWSRNYEDHVEGGCVVD